MMKERIVVLLEYLSSKLKGYQYSMQEINDNFIGNFKTGDNIQYNLEGLRILYGVYEDQNKQPYLRKLIIIQIASILETVLHDLFFRAKIHTREGIPQLSQEFIDQIRESPEKYDRFHQYIEFAKEHSIFDDLGNHIYRDMDELRKLRNRIHIQNEKGTFDPDDVKTFTPRRKSMSEKILADVMRFLSERHPRRSRAAQGNVGSFELPWDAS